jgi:hypothetical protein
MRFVETPVFTTALKRLIVDEQYRPSRARSGCGRNRVP